jgi:hypothetical protein
MPNPLTEERRAYYGHQEDKGQSRTQEAQACGAQEATAQTEADRAAGLPQAQSQEKRARGAATAVAETL